MKFIIRLLLLLGLAPFGAVAGQAGVSGLSLTNAWVRMPVPGTTMTAAFVNINNQTDGELQLLGVRALFSKVAELHDMVMVDGVMQMRHAPDGWYITPGAILTLAKGGKHVMLMGLQRSLPLHQSVMLEFNFADFGWVAVAAQVEIQQP